MPTTVAARPGVVPDRDRARRRATSARAGCPDRTRSRRRARGARPVSTTGRKPPLSVDDPERRRRHSVDANRPIPHGVQRAADIGIVRDASRASMSESGPSPERDHEVPHDARSLRARRGVGEPGAEREAADDAEHADDRADQRRSHGDRAAAAPRLDREARSDRERRREPDPRGQPTDRRRRRLDRLPPAHRPERGRRSRSRARRSTIASAATPSTNQSAWIPDVEVVAARLADREARRQEHRSATAMPVTTPTTAVSERGKHQRPDRDAAVGADRAPRRHVGRARAHRPCQRLPDQHAADDRAPRARTGAGRLARRAGCS